MPNWQDILTPSRVTAIVSRVKTQGNVLTRYMGMAPGGANVKEVSGRTYTYDIFDNVRSVALGKVAGAPAGAIAPNPVGNNTVTLARFAEKIALDYNKVSAIRQLGENAGVEDRMGVRYVEAQARFIRQRSDNIREFILGSLSRGGIYYFYQNGFDLVPTYESSSTLFGVDLRIPASNKLIGGSFAAGLQMGTGANIIDASWATDTTQIDVHLMKISAAFQSLYGAPLATVVTDSTTWLGILQNTRIRNMAGSSNQPFASYTMTPDTAPDGSLTGLQIGKIRGLEWIDFVIYDGVLNVATTNATTFANTRVIQESYCVFLAAGWDEYFKMVEGSEPVKDNDLAPAVERVGFYSWIMEKADPARMELHTLQNIGAELTVPNAIAVARVR